MPRQRKTSKVAFDVPEAADDQSSLLVFPVP